MIECPSCQSTDIYGVEYAATSPNHYNGASEYSCGKCGKRYGRWTRRELTNDEEEVRYGGNEFDPQDEFLEANRDISNGV